MVLEHMAGGVHRDLKPTNIFFTDAGAAKLGDFGVAHLQDSAYNEVMSRRLAWSTILPLMSLAAACVPSLNRQFPDADAAAIPDSPTRAAEAWTMPDLSGQDAAADAVNPKDLASGPAEAAPTGKIVMVAMIDPMIGYLGGIAGADTICHAQAVTTQQKGTFKAFLSAATRNAKDLVPASQASLPVVNLLGQPLFPSWSSVFVAGKWPGSGAMQNFLKQEVNGGKWGDSDSWHGTKPDGTVSTGLTCKDWLSASPLENGAGGELDVKEVLKQDSYSCEHMRAVVCVAVVL